MKFFILLFSFSAFAESYKIAGEKLDFKTFNSVEYFCDEKSCAAVEALKRKDKIKPEEFPAKKHPSVLGSDVCLHHYKAKTLLGRNSNNDGRAFCLFPDQSMIELNSLTKFAEKSLK